MKISHAVIVTGDRKWTDGETLGAKMAQFPEGTLFIHGNAVGADTWCDEMASQLGYPRIRVPYFAHLGRAGGPVRNGYMLQVLLGLRAHGAKIVVLAFHDNIEASKGTKDMIRQAQKAGVKVRLIKHGRAHGS